MSEYDEINISFITSSFLYTGIISPREEEIRLLEEQVNEVSRIIHSHGRQPRCKLHPGNVPLNELDRFVSGKKSCIIHFCGYNIKPDDADSLSPALSQLFFSLRNDIKCIVLAPCYAFEQAKALANHIDCVITLAEDVPYKAAMDFTGSFYVALDDEKDIQEAIDRAMFQLIIHKIPDPQSKIKKNTKPNIDPKSIKFQRKKKEQEFPYSLLDMFRQMGLRQSSATSETSPLVGTTP